MPSLTATPALDTDRFVTGARLSDDVATRATNGAAALLRADASPAVR